MKWFPLYVALLLTVLVGNASAQTKKHTWQVDRFRFSTMATYGYLPFNMTTVTESKEERGQYEMQETNASLHNFLIQAEVVIPFYRTSNWSVGSKLGAGAGLQASQELDGLNGNPIYDFTQFLYYRNYGTAIDFSILAGYKYNKSPFSTHFALGGVEFKAYKNSSVRLYGSLNSHKYYQMFTDGRIAPLIKIREFGVSIVNSF